MEKRITLKSTYNQNLIKNRLYKWNIRNHLNKSEELIFSSLLFLRPNMN